MNSKNKYRFIFSVTILVGILLLSACSETPAEVMKEEPPLDAPKSDAATEPETQSEETAPSTEDVEEGLPADPQTILFTASDGFDLIGTYYPAAKKSQPLVILMHWAPGDQNDWVEIAYWLQNRGLGGNTELSDSAPWLDTSWFPTIDQETSINVFTFTFRDCEGGCKRFASDEWYLDAQAAVEKAYALEGIDQTRIVVIGTSIGSDGAADGCAYVNTLFPNVCKGAMSFSPGNYLNVDFGETVKQLGEESEPKPVWCFYSEAEADMCGNITGGNYQPFPYADDSVFLSGHGMELITPISDPNPLEKILEFLEMVF
jgi:hypothetical protein